MCNTLRFLQKFLLIAWLVPAFASASPHVVLQTSMGEIELELYPDKAPVTVKNFLDYVNSGFYDRTVFHRVIFDWIIQGGGYDSGLNPRKTRPPIKNEADNGLENVSGTIAMARTEDPDSADSQFFINISDNHSLDHTSNSKLGYGYCVFGRVVRGMDVVRAISDVDTHEVEDFGANVPVKPVILKKAVVLGAAAQSPSK